MSPSVSLVVASYNQPNALAFVLEGVLTQTVPPRELLIADDGSEADTRELVERFRDRAPFDVVFTTQEDRGFRKASAQNNAIRESHGDHVLFLDGDCVPAPKWIEFYAGGLRRADFAVGGVRYLSLEESRSLTPEQVAERGIDRFASPANRRFFRGMHWRELCYRAMRKPRKPRIKGGNWAVRREALFAVNGFDERFDGFGKEDSDIRNRLRNSGFTGRSLWHTNWVYHVAHELDPWRLREDLQRGQPDREYFESRRHTRRCDVGIVRDRAS